MVFYGWGFECLIETLASSRSSLTLLLPPLNILRGMMIMKRKTLSILMLFVLVFTMLPLSAFASTTSQQIQGQGELVIIGQYGGPSGYYPYGVIVYNESGTVVYQNSHYTFGGIGTGDSGTDSFVVPNLPSGTYTVETTQSLASFIF